MELDLIAQAEKNKLRQATRKRNERGSAADRRARRDWLLQAFGDGTHALCFRCPTMLDALTLTVDRIVPGAWGGSYVRNNIRPACRHCNCSLGASQQLRLVTA